MCWAGAIARGVALPDTSVGWQVPVVPRRCGLCCCFVRVLVAESYDHVDHHVVQCLQHLKQEHRGAQYLLVVAMSACSNPISLTLTPFCSVLMIFLCAEFVLFWVRKLQIASLRLFVVYSRVLRAAVLEVFRFRCAHPCNSPQTKKLPFEHTV